MGADALPFVATAKAETVALFHIVRHPTCVLNELGRYQGRETNSPFSARGHRQACALAHRLVEVPLDRILIPPQTLRHRQLAEVINAVRTTPAPIVEDRFLAEVSYGAWECLTKAECAECDPELWETFQRASPIDGDFAFPGGSRYGEVRDDIAMFLSGLACDEDVLAISSSMTIRVLVGTIARRDPGHVRQCTLTTFSVHSSEEPFTAVRLFEDGFLQGV